MGLTELQSKNGAIKLSAGSSSWRLKLKNDIFVQVWGWEEIISLHLESSSGVTNYLLVAFSNTKFGGKVPTTLYPAAVIIEIT
jgi:hypothetical protein